MADYWTDIKASGTKSELVAMIMVLHKYGYEAKKQYLEQHDCWYFDDFTSEEISDEELDELTESGTLKLSLSGPYGVAYDPYSDYDVLFTDLADAAPKAQFNITIEGFDAGGDFSAAAELKNGKLDYNIDYGNDEEWDDDDED